MSAENLVLVDEVAGCFMRNKVGSLGTGGFELHQSWHDWLVETIWKVSFSQAEAGSFSESGNVS
jgi:hypothetical protein